MGHQHFKTSYISLAGDRADIIGALLKPAIGNTIRLRRDGDFADVFQETKELQ